MNEQYMLLIIVHLTSSRILTSYTEKIQHETMEDFGNFIMQAICPTHDELKGIFEHNKWVHDII
jgi:hypothetical protein